MRIAWIAGALLGALIAANAAQAQQAAPPTHSLAEMAPFIGRWDCTVTEAGRPTSHMSAVYDWLCDGKALREVITAPGYSGVFATTYDRRSNSFKGVAVGSDGGAIVWENPGFTGNHASEVGYVFGAGRLVPISRTETEIVSTTHYIIRDFGPDTASGGRGPATDTENCTKLS